MSFFPFLQQVARHYASFDTDTSARLCFVFPNQRSGYFFSEYIKEEYRQLGNRAVLMPRVVTMSALVEQWCDLVEATPAELSLLLYRTYIDLTEQRVCNPDAPGLAPDRFMFWSDIIINDFNEVDRSLAQADHLFRNLRDIKELQTNPLTPEQIELVKQFWGTAGVPWLEHDDGRLWVSTEAAEHDTGVRNFLKLWAILGPLYNAFGKTLRNNGMCYIGMAYKDVALNIADILEADESDDIYVFTGFSELSKAEQKIFDGLRKSGRAIFHWDDTLPQLGTQEEFPLKLIRKYQERFPGPDDFKLQYPQYSPQIRLYAVPSETGQVKVAAKLLAPSKGLDRNNAVQWAVVMPETSLCLPLLNSLNLPPNVETNITMGYPLQSTAMAAVMDQLTMAKQLARRGRSGTVFNKPSLIELLTQPLLMSIAPRDTRALIEVLEQTKGLFVNWSKLEPYAGKLEFLFRIKIDGTVTETLDHMLHTAQKLLDLYNEAYGEPVEDDNQHTESTDLQREFLRAYMFQLEHLYGLVEKYRLEPYIERVDQTVGGAVAKMMRQMQVNFAGTPLKGVQLMGVLETRALDFDRLIITSMNERTFPRKLQKATFIPQTLRMAYGMESREEQEIAMAYHFYRLASRAHRIDLIYNSDTEGLTSGEISRYIYQLKYLYRYPHLKEFTLNYLPWTNSPTVIEIEKTPRVMAQLTEYLARTGSRSLSASAIKKLLACELQFYLGAVCRFNDEDDSPDHVDDSIYGKIVHFIMEHLYHGYIATDNEKEERPKPVVDSSHIERILKSNLIDKLATAAVKEIYMECPTGDNATKLEGETELFKEMAITDVKNLLRAEQKMLGKFGSMIIEHTESKKNMEMDFGHGLRVNFSYIIDRVDRLKLADGDTILRIVDYKTGKDTLSFKDVEKLVDYSGFKTLKEVPQAITQLMLYAVAYARHNNLESTAIQPLIYKFRDLSDADAQIEPIKMGATPIIDYRDLADEFIALMGNKIKTLFDVDEPFRQTESTLPCKYCDFKEICSRT